MKFRAFTVIVALIIAAVAAGGYFYHFRHSKAPPKPYEFSTVSRGSVERVIVSTGTLSPVGSVEVGTQVSGTIDRVLVDFNDTVRAGQVIAELDRSVLVSRLTEAQASHSRAEALFLQSEQEFKRGETLFGKGLISEQEFVKHRTDYHTQKASLQVAKAAVNTASENVRYTTIRSPVRGTVISRNVEVGQTVAASLSAPVLFVIAEDLRQMKIMAQVDETDIGKIRPSQEARFSVQAYPDKRYTGQVGQVRLQPEVVQNVVTYTVVVLARNDDGTLLPGMTASVEFVEARAEGALTVPMSVFRWKPPEETVKKWREKRAEERDSSGRGSDDSHAGEAVPGRRASDQGLGGQPADGMMMGRDGGRQRERGQGNRGQGDRGGQNRPRQNSAVPGGRGTLWTLDDTGELKPVYVRIGLNDGISAVVTGGEDLQEGMKIISGEIRKDKPPKASDNRQQRSLLPQQQNQRRF